MFEEINNTDEAICGSLETMVGTLTVTTNRTAVTGVAFSDESLIAGKGDSAKPGCPILAEALRQLREFFAGQRQQFDLPIYFAGTPFQVKAWKKIARIRFGTVMTYGEVAASLGNKNLARAVGQAANRNPIPIIVPCHRVIGGRGNLVGFAPGLNLKEVLLKHEGFL